MCPPACLLAQGLAWSTGRLCHASTPRSIQPTRAHAFATGAAPWHCLAFGRWSGCNRVSAPLTAAPASRPAYVRRQAGCSGAGRGARGGPHPPPTGTVAVPALGGLRRSAPRIQSCLVAVTASISAGAPFAKDLAGQPSPLRADYRPMIRAADFGRVGRRHAMRSGGWQRALSAGAYVARRRPPLPPLGTCHAARLAIHTSSILSQNAVTSAALRCAALRIVRRTAYRSDVHPHAVCMRAARPRTIRRHRAPHAIRGPASLLSPSRFCQICKLCKPCL